MEFVVHTEGETKLLVPPYSLTRDPPPTSPVFFNPAASLNRDVSVAVTGVTGGATFCDSMCGVGARGVRVANEVKGIERVTLVDFNADALRAAKRSAAMNRVARKCEFSSSETTSYLCSRFGSEERFDYVDVDPFGSPVRQLQGALSATSDGGVLSITATDTAALCGVYPKVSRRRYGSASLKNQFAHETGLRILAGALAREGAKLDLGVAPVLAHATRHYLRLFARVTSGAAAGDESIRHLGYISYCHRCGNTATSRREERDCTECGRQAMTAGPLWTDALAETEVVTRAAAAAERKGSTPAGRVIRSLEGVDGFPPWSFSIDGASSSLGTATAPEPLVRRQLLENGWRAMRTPFEKTGLKTDAPFSEFRLAVERSALSTRQGSRVPDE